MAVALQNNALTTITSVEQYYGEESPGDQDDDLTRLINSASAQIEKLTGRKFAQDTAAVETVPGFGQPFLMVERTPVWSVASVSLKHPGDTEIDITDIYTESEAGKIWRPNGWGDTARVERGITCTRVNGTEQPRFEVTFSGGYKLPKDLADTVVDDQRLPGDVQLACDALVAQAWLDGERNPSISMEKILSWSAQYRSSMPGPTRDVIIAWRRLA